MVPYAVTVTDANNCTSVQDTSIINEAEPILLPIAQNATCEQNNGAINLEIENGSLPFDILWSNDSTSQNIGNLSPNEYAVTITDANDCVVSTMALIENESSPLINLNAENSTCGDANGTIALNIEEGTGTAPFDFVWSNDSITQNLANLLADNYAVTVIDANDCESTSEIEVADEGAAIIALSAENETCSNSNGTINLSIEEGTGTAPFEFIWSNDSTSQNLIGLTANSYMVTLTDANDCTAIETIMLENEAAPILSTSIVDATCSNSEGQVNLQIEGGTAPFTFDWSNGTTTQNLSNVPVGDYSVVVTDNNECTATITAMVMDMGSTLELNLEFFEESGTTSDDGIICPNNSITINANVEGGDGNFDYQWDNNLASTQAQTLTLDASTAFTVTITDGDGCSISSTATVTVTAELIAVLDSNSPICEGGDLNLDASGGTIYEWTGPNDFTSELATPSLAGVSENNGGIYTVIVTDNNNCSTSESVEVNILTEGFFPALPEVSNEFICEGEEELTLFGNTYPEFGISGMWFAEDSGEPLVGDTVTVTDLNYGLNTFTYELNGDNCELGMASVEVWFEQPPIAVNDVVRTGENVPVRKLDILANDNIFINGQPNLRDWEFRINPTDRLEFVINADNTIDIIPDESFFGAKEITYQLISENCSPAATGTISLTVTPSPEEKECVFDTQQEAVWNPCFDIPEQNELIIMNRYGKIVFVASNYNVDNGWDGTFPVDDPTGINEKKLLAPIGTYYFILKDKREQGEDVLTTGAILVLR